MTNFKKITLGLVAASAAALTTTIAHAGQGTAKVAEVVPEQRVLALDDGKKFTVHTHVDLHALKAGTPVSVSYIEPMPIFREMGFDGFATEVAPLSS